MWTLLENWNIKEYCVLFGLFDDLLSSLSEIPFSIKLFRGATMLEHLKYWNSNVWAYTKSSTINVAQRLVRRDESIKREILKIQCSPLSISLPLAFWRCSAPHCSWCDEVKPMGCEDKAKNWERVRDNMYVRVCVCVFKREILSVGLCVFREREHRARLRVTVCVRVC